MSNGELTPMVDGMPADITEMPLDLSKDEKLRMGALMLAIRYHVDTIINDADYLRVMMEKEREAKFSNDSDEQSRWHLSPTTVHKVVHIASEFEQFLLGNRPAMSLIVGNEKVEPGRVQTDTQDEA